MDNNTKILSETLLDYYRINLNKLSEKLHFFNLENDTNFEITHNGLELWINFGEAKYVNQDVFNSVYELVANNGFSKRSIYGNRYVGISLGKPDYDLNQLKLNL